MEYRDYPILYVDDDEQNRVVMRYNLKGFKLLEAASAEAALEILAVEPIAVLLADQRMPRLSGVDLAEQCLARHPQVVRVIITAYADLDATVDAINRGRVSRFLKKPWAVAELTAVVRESIDSYHRGRRLEQLEQQLQSQERLSVLGLLAASLAHDLRQPMTNFRISCVDFDRELRALQLAVRLGRGGEELRPIADSLRTAFTDVETAQATVDKLLLSITRAINPNMEEEPIEDVLLGELARDVLQVHRLSIASGHVTARVEEPDGPLTLRGHSAPLLQLFGNLVRNAVQSFEPERRLPREVVLRIGRADGQALIEVQDNGPGIAPDRLPHLFDLFYTTKGAAGTGLGLAISRQLVTQLGGTIAVESALGQGTTFKVRLPLVSPPLVASASASASGSSSAAASRPDGQ